MVEVRAEVGIAPLEKPLGFRGI